MTTQTQTQPPAEQPDLLTLEDLAERLQVSVTTDTRMVAARQMRAFKLAARVWRVRRVDYEAYLAGLGK